MQVEGACDGVLVDKGSVAAEDEGISAVSGFEVVGRLHYGVTCTEALFLLDGDYFGSAFSR